jgi:hypothetical protein
VAINSTYILLQKQIADELEDNQALLSPLSGNSGLLSPIQNAIQAAIAKWEREPFYFNDFRLEPLSGGPFNTVNGQEFYTASDYALIGTLACIKSLRVLISANRYTLNERDDNYLNTVSVNPLNTGQPTDYTYDTQKLRLYPIPNGAYPMGITGTQRLSALSADTDANAWTQDAFDLIRCEAKLIIGRDVIYDEKVANSAKVAIYGDPLIPEDRGYLGALKKETSRRHANRARVRPSSF